ncbi:MAG: hypothetical protein R3297_04790, partial [Desulfobulbales bacterium]|nr:hypothetical protein [Desulfobulbales bacterium]
MPEKYLHTLLIEKLVPGGLGLARLESGLVVMVRHVLPAEKVLVRQIRRKKDYIAATLEKVLSPSPERCKPPCPYYGRCGGCDLQHAEYGTQVRLKKEILAESLTRAGGDRLLPHRFSIETPLPSAAQFGYRQRLRFQVDKAGSYGFFHPESHRIEPVSRCLLAKNELNHVLGQLHGSGSFKGLVSHCSGFELLFNP